MARFWCVMLPQSVLQAPGLEWAWNWAQEERLQLPIQWLPAPALLTGECLVRLYNFINRELINREWEAASGLLAWWLKHNVSSCCCCSVAKLCLILCSPMDCSSPGSSVLHCLLELAQIHVLWVGDAIQPSHPLSSSSSAINLSPHQGLFWWPKYWSFSFSISPSSEYSGLISFTIDWFDLTVQGTLKSLLQHQNLKALVLQRSAFFMVQLSHLYVTTGKTRALAIQTFVGKAKSLLFNTLSGFVIAFLQRSKRFLISWLHSLYIGLFLLFLVHSHRSSFDQKRTFFDLKLEALQNIMLLENLTPWGIMVIST